ncbi:hypothetical protein [Okeania sp. SIO2C9]|nr:hypothetical protein [Okeania sp. SIO2C9]
MLPLNFLLPFAIATFMPQSCYKLKTSVVTHLAIALLIYNTK